jgi:signal transduction histidine kinase
MKPNTRRASLVLIAIALWTAPYFLPFHALGVSLVARLGAIVWVAPGSLPLPEGERSVDAGWYVALALGIVWPLLMTWTVVEELPALERRSRSMRLAWPIAAVTGIAVASLSWILWPSLCFWCAHWETSSALVKTRHIALVEAGVAIAAPSWLVLASRAVRRPIDVERIPVHRWVTGVALCLFVTPPFLLLAKSGELILFAIAWMVTCVRETTALEQRVPLRKWRRRSLLLAVAAVPLVVVALRGGRVGPLSGENWLPLMHLGAALLVAGSGLAFVVVCMSAADGLAWALRHAATVRARMLVLGLTCAALAFALAGVYVPVNVVGQGEATASLALTLLSKLVCLAIVVWTFSATLSRGLSRSLEQSVRGISEIRRGNLGVTLDESGNDEVAAIARSFNQLIALLREAEFLERINAELRSRGAQLAQALEALRTAQADLVRSERMASVATLVKGIAHELNNPINYIAGNVAPLQRYCEFLTRVATELSDGEVRSQSELVALTRLTDRKDLRFVTEDLARLTADIAEGARRAKLIISDLQSLTSVAQRGVEQVDLHRIARQTIALLGPGVPQGVRLTAELDPVPPLTARAGQLEQVFVNLTDNAVRAAREAVQLYVGSDGGEALIRVSDDGPGMTAEVKRQAFEPFFTTRAPGEGSGLGLTIVASIVRSHQGSLTLTSELGRGTEVEVRLPVPAQT